MKNLSNFKIVTLDGETYDMQDYGIIIESFNPLPPEFESYTETIPFRDGFLDYGGQYRGRTINVVGGFKAKDGQDYRQMRNKVFRLFDARKWFYVINDAEPNRRWLVRTESDYSLERLSDIMAKFSINLISKSPYAESVGTTLSPASFDQLIQANNDNYINDPIQYEFENESVFKVWNDGDVEIDPRQYDLKIIFEGSSTNLAIKNLTTNEEWQYNGQTQLGDVIELDGIKFTKNSLSIFKDTNHKLITLVPGWNEFEITGATDFKISFDFRFYYL